VHCHGYWVRRGPQVAEHVRQAIFVRFTCRSYSVTPQAWASSGNNTVNSFLLFTSTLEIILFG
jgi:hypothetical protein